MAIQTGKFVIGTLAYVSFRVIDGKQILQSRPAKGTMKQTKETKKSAGHFGKASSLSKGIRQQFMYMLRKSEDGKMYARLTSELHQSLNLCFNRENLSYTFKEDSFKKLEGFDFNKKSPLKESLQVSPEATLSDGIVTISLPEIKINEELKFPSESSSCKIHIYTKSHDLEEGYCPRFFHEHTITVNSTQKIVEKQEFTFAIPAGCLYITSIFLSYYSTNYGEAILMNNQTFNPSGICAAFVNSGTFELSQEDHNSGPRINTKAAFGKSATTNPASLRLLPSYNLHTGKEPGGNVHF